MFNYEFRCLVAPRERKIGFRIQIDLGSREYYYSLGSNSHRFENQRFKESGIPSFDTFMLSLCTSRSRKYTQKQLRRKNVRLEIAS